MQWHKTLEVEYIKQRTINKTSANIRKKATSYRGDVCDHKSTHTYYVKQALNLWRGKLKEIAGVLYMECG
jgi:hypothetical protein